MVYDRGVVETNQRLRFDVSPDGHWIVAGDEVSFSDYGMEII